jgi:hypothetical protein
MKSFEVRGERSMHRLNMNLTKRQFEQLSKEARRIGINLGELIRRILDQYIDSKRETTKEK